MKGRFAGSGDVSLKKVAWGGQFAGSGGGFIWKLIDGAGSGVD